MHDRSETVFLLLQLDKRDISLFRFLLEAYGHAGYFTVLERHSALLKFACPKDCEGYARQVLGEIAETLTLSVKPWPIAAD